MEMEWTNGAEMEWNGMDQMEWMEGMDGPTKEWNGMEWNGTNGMEALCGRQGTVMPASGVGVKRPDDGGLRSRSA